MIYFLSSLVFLSVQPASEYGLGFRERCELMADAISLRSYSSPEPISFGARQETSRVCSMALLAYKHEHQSLRFPKRLIVFPNATCSITDGG